MKYKAIVSGHIWLDEDGKRDIEILTQIDNEDDTEIFCDIEQALTEHIEIGDEEDYYFIAVVESEFERTVTYMGIEYDVIHHVKEIKSARDLTALS